MRALYLPTTQALAGQSLLIEGEAHHHLAHVIRLQVGEELKLLNGLGGVAEVRVTGITKRVVEVKVLAVSEVPPQPSCDVLILTPKREALELMLKMATELGVGRIFLLRGALSPERLPVDTRLSALLRSALEQSNNPWLPELILCPQWEAVPVADYAAILLLDLAPVETTVRNTGQKTLLVVGPEGGFSADERQRFQSWPHSQTVSLVTPILRAPTALAAGIGWWLSRA